MALLLALSLFAARLHAQPNAEEYAHLSVNKLKKMAEHAERYGDAYTALQFYTPYAQKKAENAKVQQHLAELHERVRDYAAAAAAYHRVFELDERMPEALYKHATMLKMTGKAEDAKVQFELLASLVKPNGYDKSWRRTAADAIASCDTAIALLARPLNITVENLGGGINGPHAEFAPIPYGTDKLIYGSIKEQEIRSFHVDSARTMRRLYLAEKVGDVWMDAGLWKASINDGSAHIANGAFSVDGRTFIYTRCEENWRKQMECALWLVREGDNGWGEPERLDEEINVPGSMATMPTMALDPRKGYDVLYYASNRPDGQGGMDIWYSYYDAKKKAWRKPRNLGRRINGPGDELTPLYNNKQKKLYYSSESWPGLGGLDVFAARGELQKFAEPQNVAYPINSAADDLYYVLNDDRETGFLVSNRSGGYQMINETCCDDLYSFYIPDVIHLAMQGFVMQVDEEDYLKGAGDKLSTKSFNANFLDGVTVDLYIVEDSVEVLMQRSITKGDGRYFVDFEPNNRYRVVLSRSGYFSNHVEVDTRGMNKSDTLFQNVGLGLRTDAAVVVENILFEFDSSDLTDDSRAKIDEGMLRVLIENPEIIVEIGAHTDNKGSDSYNQRLSQQRAESVIGYIASRGISKNRLKAKGYGSSKPVAANANPDGSDNPEGRAQNRRTEFRVVGELAPSASELDAY